MTGADDLAIPKTQRAAVSRSAKEGTRVEEMPVVQADELEVGQALVKVLYSGVCYSDLHLVDDDWGPRVSRPALVGHEGAGVIVAINDPLSKLKVGDRVGIKYVAGSCNQCEYCYDGDDMLCTSVKFAGLTAPGTFQQYCPTYTSQLTPLPASLSLSAAAPVLCAGVTVWRALRDSGARAGDWVAIPGAGGGMGAFAIQYAKYAGLKVVAIDTGAKKRALCAELGADEWIDFEDVGEGLVQAVKSATSGGAHAALVLAPRGAAIEAATSYVRPRGVVVIVGLPSGGPVRFDPLSAVREKKVIRGAMVGNRRDAIDALAIVAQGHVNVPVEVRPLDQIQRTYDEMRRGEIMGRVVLDLFK